MLITGSNGEARTGHITAVELLKWSLSRHSTLGVEVSTLTATIGRFDEYWSKQPITSIWLHMGRGSWWVWDSVKSSHSKGSVIELELEGNPEVRVNHREVGKAWQK